MESQHDHNGLATANSQRDFAGVSKSGASMRSESFGKTPDPYRMYIEAVQNPPKTVKQCTALYREKYGRLPKLVREDFCGTAANCIEWIKVDASAQLIGVDIDAEPLDWCKSNLTPSLSQTERDRLRLIHDDVASDGAPSADLILALNSSFCSFKKRSELLVYLRQCHTAMREQGMIIVEVYSGPEAQMVGTDEIPCEGFTAIWDQASFNAVANETIAHLHFLLEDGGELCHAFSYDWRLWSPAELVDALEEAGFHGVKVYKSEMDEESPCEACRLEVVPSHWTVYIAGAR